MYKAGVYILQNTMVVGGGWLLGKKMKTDGVGKKMKKKGKGEKEKGEKRPKNDLNMA